MIAEEKSTQDANAIDAYETRLAVPRVDRFALDGALDAPVWPPVPCAALVLQQTWLPKLELKFQMTTAWLAATPDAFLFFATLHDRDVRTRVEKDHEPIWDLGDAFEIFLQPGGGDGYFEYQVAPNGRILQLHYPEVGAPRHDGIERYIYRAPLLEAKVRVEPESGRWRVAVRLPVAALLAPRSHLANDEWRVAFCRYDYDAKGQFVLSSSALLTQPNFHRIGEWTRIAVPDGFRSFADA